jgi:type I restriction enzyme R subunit
MNEAETSAELIDPNMKACSCGVIEGSKILHDYNITASKIQAGGSRSKKNYCRLFVGL